MSCQWKWGGFAFLTALALCFTVLSPIVGHAACPADIISYWTLGETVAPYVDIISGNNGAVGPGAPTPAAGRVNGGQLFGTGTGISVPSNTAYDWDSTESFSIELWMRYTGTSLATNQVFVGRDTETVPASGFRWWVGLHQTDGKARFSLRAGSYSVDLDGGVISDGTFHHVVAVRNADLAVILLYVDGALSNSIAFATANPLSGNAAVTIGYLVGAAGFHFNGIIDEVAIYGRALQPAEIQQHYKNGLRGVGYCGGGTAPWIPLLLGD